MASENIVLELYKAVIAALKAMQVGGEPVFNFVGHYNQQELADKDNFSYKTPAVFVSLDSISWDKTKLQSTQNTSREQDGTVQLTLHYFFYDLRTDTDSYLEHWQLLTDVHHVLTGLRSTAALEGKFSSLKRIRERDSNKNYNLRQLMQTYESFVQQAGIEQGLPLATPTELDIIKDIIK